MTEQEQLEKYQAPAGAQLPLTRRLGLERRMEAAWRDLTAEELRCRPNNQHAVARCERAYDRYLAAMDAYMRHIATEKSVGKLTAKSRTERGLRGIDDVEKFRPDRGATPTR